MTKNKLTNALQSWLARPGLIPLRGRVQHYAWGGTEYIPALIGQENSDEQPFAELWLGTHPKAPALAVIDGVEIPLNELVAAAPARMLGNDVCTRFQAELPYLFKVLDARQMLSIQVHPTKEQAVRGFAAEEERGVARDAPDRNYRDRNHKPEIHVALTEFWMLHGFRPLAEIAASFRSIPELRTLADDFLPPADISTASDAARGDMLRHLYRHIMEMPQAGIDALLQPLLARLRKRDQEPCKNDPDYWALRAADHFRLPGDHCDRGILSIYLLNLVHLQPGEGTFQAAGVLHAYLEGCNVELMATSDNVLRGGLTPKHIDVPELLATLSYEDRAPAILRGRSADDGSLVFSAPVDEFELSRVRLRAGESFEGTTEQGPVTLIVSDGSVEIDGNTFERGSAVFAASGLAYRIVAQTDACLFRAGLP